MFKDIVYIVSQCYKKNVAAYVSLGVLKQIQACNTTGISEFSDAPFFGPNPPKLKMFKKYRFWGSNVIHIKISCHCYEADMKTEM